MTNNKHQSVHGMGEVFCPEVTISRHYGSAELRQKAVERGLDLDAMSRPEVAHFLLEVLEELEPICEDAYWVDFDLLDGERDEVLFTTKD